MSDFDRDDPVTIQSKIAECKYGSIQKRSPLLKGEKKMFDSADYFMEQHKLMQAMGLEPDIDEQKVKANEHMEYEL